jgi:NAD-dependent DNA ligase (contains BRCT domain type II)
MLDPNGQPLNLAFNSARRTERDICELLGLAKGLLADGVVTEAEAGLLHEWTRRHPDAQEYWAITALCKRLERAFSDGVIDEAERADLAELLETLVGGQAGVIAGADASTELPLDRPPPSISWAASVFVFTGKFAFGPRKDCERQVRNLGGHCEPNITQRTNYLIIGTFGSRDWVHTSFGRKIEKAVGYRESGTPLAIIAEDHWAGSLP